MAPDAPNNTTEKNTPKKRRTQAQINAAKKRALDKRSKEITAQTEKLNETARLVETSVAALDEKIAAFEVRIGKASDHSTDHREVNEETIAKSADLTGMGEIGHPEGVERMTDTDLLNSKDAIELEAFMQELVEIVIHEDGNENAVTIPLPNVNGKNQGFFRGKPQWVKRKYLEALEHATITKYVQVRDDAKPDIVQMRLITAPVFPFAVLTDPNPLGKQWLKNLKEQA